MLFALASAVRKLFGKYLHFVALFANIYFQSNYGGEESYGKISLEGNGKSGMSYNLELHEQMYNENGGTPTKKGKIGDYSWEQEKFEPTEEQKKFGKLSATTTYTVAVVVVRS